MPRSSENKNRRSNLEAELYLLISKFLKTGPCKRAAEVLREEIEEHHLLPKRVDWLGNEHSRSFNELGNILSGISDDHLLKICTRIGPILDKEIPPTVPGLTSLLGVGRQSLLRTPEDLLKPKCQGSYLAARKNGMPLLPSPAAQSTFPPNITQVLISRELSGAITSRHAFSPKIYARQQLYRRLLGHLSSVYCVLFDRTGKYIFTGADDLLVKIWSAVDGRLLAALRGHSAEITDMAVNYENTLLAAGSCDKTIRVWCLRTTAPVAVLNGHTGMVTSLQFCPYPKNKDQLLISTGNDGCICFWQWNTQTNAFNPKPLKFTERTKAGAQMICSSFSPGGLFLATGSTDHNVRVYNIAGMNGPEKILEREVHVDRVDSLQFSNLDCRFVSGSKDGTALIWKYEKQNWSSIQLKMTTKLGNQSDEAEDTKVKLRVTMVGWTLDDSKVITAVSDCTIKVWNSYDGNLCHVLRGHEDEVFVLEAHPTDPRIFLSSGHDGRIILWDLVTGSLIKNHFNLIEGQGHGAVFDCKFSPDGLMFASTDSHGHLCIFGFGSADRYKKVPEEQFFHTDYRPLIRDIHHHVLDEQTQTAPHLLPPPFLVDIDGNPYSPNVQRLVPGREHCNDSQLIPYVAVSAEGDSEILEPVRPANENLSDRPTIDDMIERLQQEQNQSFEQRDGSENGSPRSSSDSFRSPHSSRLHSTGDRNGSEPFSPRTPRSQAGHSRVGLRRTGDVEGVQSVGNWQSRGTQENLPSWVKRVVVKPLTSSVASSYLQKRVELADHELAFFSRERKKRIIPDPCEQYHKQDRNDSRWQQRRGLRNRSKTQEESFNDVFGEEYENPETMNFNSSSESESEQKEEWSDSSEESGSGEYSDWIEDVGLSERNKSNPKPGPSGTTSRPAKTRKPVTSSDDESEAENGDEEEDNDENTTVNDSETPRGSRRKSALSRKKTAVNGKKLPERFRPPEWLTDVMPHKAPYVPQIGDEILYFRQGHELYVQAVKRNRIYDIYMRSQPWRKINLRDQEVARIEDITFENHPPRLCCLKLCLLNPANKQADTFVVKYHDMADVIDFIVLKQNYDQAMHYDWKSGDRFRSAIDKAWWLGTIKAQKPLNPNFPDSMFQCFLVKWDNGEKEHMSPWDFEPVDNERLPDEEGGSVEITPEERLCMMYVPEIHEWSSFGREHDCDRIARGFTRIMELSIAEPFVTPVDLNLYPSYAIVVEYPMDLGTIKARVQNRFYRRLDAVRFDIRYIHLNAQKFNEPGSRIVKQAKCIVDLCTKFADSPNCRDPMILYHEMMEAKQSRSQDSQSELDVLCSESDSDGEHYTSNRLKRKKQNAIQQSSKRVRLGSQKYTSNSWKQQCVALSDSIFQWDDSTPFRYPVDLNEYPDYRNIIDCPMDLSTVRERLSNNHYNSPTDFCKDMRLIFQNSRNYNTNKKSRIYSMTIRLSAMFEEHIRSIVSDWRSAVKYEEKIRNNQYVSNRRKPLPVQEAGVNVGASTSRAFTSCLPSSVRSDTSRHTINRVLNAAYIDNNSSRSSNSSKITNGTGPKKKSKLQVCTSSKSSKVIVKKKTMKSTVGSSLTNGVAEKSVRRVSKRKLPERSPKKSKNIKKKEISNTDGSQSDSNASNPSNNSPTSSGSDDTNWGSKTKRCRKDPDCGIRKSLRITKSTRHTRSSSSYHPDSRISSRSRARTATFSHLRNHSRSSTPENRWVSVKKRPVKHNSSPLHTRSKRLLRNSTSGILNSLRRNRMKPQKYQSSGESSESDASESQSSKCGRNSNNSGCSNTSSSRKNAIENAASNSKTEQTSSKSESSESEDNSDEEEERAQRLTRATRASRHTLPSSVPETTKSFSGRIQTRNCGQRTVRYKESDEEEEEDDEDEEDDPQNYDSENTERVISYSSRGRLRSLIRNSGIQKQISKTSERIIATRFQEKYESTVAKKETSDSDDNLSDSKENSSSNSEYKFKAKAGHHNVGPIIQKNLKSRLIKHRRFSHSSLLHHEKSVVYSSPISSHTRSSFSGLVVCSNPSRQNYKWMKLRKKTLNYKLPLSSSKNVNTASQLQNVSFRKNKISESDIKKWKYESSEPCSSENTNTSSTSFKTNTDTEASCGKQQSLSTKDSAMNQNKKKWFLRSNHTGSANFSFCQVSNRRIETQDKVSDKIQTRNRGQRTMTYEEDIDDFFLLENEDLYNINCSREMKNSDRPHVQHSLNEKKWAIKNRTEVRSTVAKLKETSGDSSGTSVSKTKSKQQMHNAFPTSKNVLSKLCDRIQTRNSASACEKDNAHSLQKTSEPMIFSSRGRLCKLTSRARAFLLK